MSRTARRQERIDQILEQKSGVDDECTSYENELQRAQEIARSNSSSQDARNRANVDVHHLTKIVDNIERMSVYLSMNKDDVENRGFWKRRKSDDGSGDESSDDDDDSDDSVDGEADTDDDADGVADTDDDVAHDADTDDDSQSHMQSNANRSAAQPAQMTRPIDMKRRG